MFIKNVNAKQGQSVYLEHKMGDEFPLALSFQPHNIQFGDLIVLVYSTRQFLKLTKKLVFDGCFPPLKAGVIGSVFREFFIGNF